MNFVLKEHHLLVDIDVVVRLAEAASVGVVDLGEFASAMTACTVEFSFVRLAPDEDDVEEEDFWKILRSWMAFITFCRNVWDSGSLLSAMKLTVNDGGDFPSCGHLVHDWRLPIRCRLDEHVAFIWTGRIARLGLDVLRVLGQLESQCGSVIFYWKREGALHLDEREGESSISGDGLRCVLFSLNLLVAGRVVHLVPFRCMRDVRISLVELAAPFFSLRPMSSTSPCLMASASPTLSQSESCTAFFSLTLSCQASYSARARSTVYC